MKKRGQRARRSPSYYTPPASPQPATFTTSKSLLDITDDEAVIYLQQLMARIEQKMGRERAYLARRASHGTRTPTDQVLEEDLILQGEVMTLLDDLYRTAKERMGMP